MLRTFRTAAKVSPSFVAQNRIRMVNGWLGARVNMSTTAAKDAPEADVLHRKHLSSRTFVLNRPKALNALNLSMVRNMTPQLQAWDASDLCKVIVIKGSGEKAFCAGGDVRQVVELAQNKKHDEALAFFAEEYKLNHMIATLKTPFVAILNGITMGGGVGLSVHAPFRIATEKTLFAMPETNIGLFPDVGGSFFLPRLDGETGTYLGLVGTRLKGIDTVYAGIATHYVPSERLVALEDRLSELETDNHDVINMAIEDFVSEPLHDHKYAISDNRNAIDRCFRFNTIEEIVAALEQENTDFAKKTLKTLRSVSPTSLKITLQQIREGAHLGIADCFRMEHQLARECLYGNDFAEGVRALLIDKTNEPHWQPPTIEAVDREQMLGQYFRNESPVPLELSSTTTYNEYPYRRYGLPTEDEIRSVVTGEAEGSGPLQLTAEEVADVLVKKSGGKIGVREKVMEVLSRKVSKGAEGELKWID
ncbi:3-hydroxyisobutyryl-CoA hydrolase [Entomortierella parvispora]|uniref:3-hydroxyisobutyryl-CoA hydrolase n=1 Tax=Entomortierella parvispora TaxID=205924 RepID=A0A9P3H163_9FUNG|nr:3-hydroxyisobutyryl-CoA hydrolase [Entomortierella parvispora]